MSPRPGVSVVLSTYNRARLLDGALASLAAQKTGGVAYEVVVVDNASTDGTHAVVEGWAARTGGRVRYLYEGRQGVSYGRNTGIVAARAPVVAITDDDVRPEPGWIAAIVRALREHPDAGFVGGAVVPEWPHPQPRWLTSEHWSPLGITGYGDRAFPCDAARRVSLLTACLAVRRSAFAQAGVFSPAVQRVRDGIGSLEDAELVTRFVDAGIVGMYVPSIRVRAPVDPVRMTRAYHRRWHTGHGRFHARLRDRELDRSSLRVLGVPGHLLRAGVRSAAAWAACMLRGDRDRAFLHETRVRFAWGFVRERVGARGAEPAAGEAEGVVGAVAPEEWRLEAG